MNDPDGKIDTHELKENPNLVDDAEIDSDSLREFSEDDWDQFSRRISDAMDQSGVIWFELMSRVSPTSTFKERMRNTIIENKLVNFIGHRLIKRLATLALAYIIVLLLIKMVFFTMTLFQRS